MNRTLYVSAFALLTFATGIAVAQDDLASFARQQRQQKKPSAKKVYTNDDFSSSQPMATAAAAPAATAAKTDTVAAKPKEASVDQKAQLAAALQQKVDGIKAEIATLNRELDIASRENKLRVANYYADAGNSLRDPKKWQDEQKATQDEIANKQKAIDAAKAKLDAALEEGRRAGIRVND